MGLMLGQSEVDTAAVLADESTMGAGTSVSGAAAGGGSGGFDASVMFGWLFEHLLHFVLAVVVLILAWLVGSWLRRLVRRGAQRARIDLTVGRFLGNLAKWALIVFAMVICMGMIGIETASFAAILAAAGFAIGFALKDTLSDLAAGMLLLVFRPFKANDMVRIAGETGIVDEIELFFTMIDTLDGRRVLIPSSKVLASPIENITHHPRRRVDIPVGVEYRADIDETRRALEAAARSVEVGLKDPPPAVVLVELGTSSVNWQVRVWAPKQDFQVVRQATVRAIKYALDDAGIGIPFPQMEVHLNQRMPASV